MTRRNAFQAAIWPGYHWYFAPGDPEPKIVYSDGDPNNRWPFSFFGDDRTFGFDDLPGVFVGPIELSNMPDENPSNVGFLTHPNPHFIKALEMAGVEVRQDGTIFKTKNTFGNVGKNAMLALAEAILFITSNRRLDRQSTVHTWCRKAFGDDHAKSIEQRGIRLAEEAIEAAQASNCKREMLHHLVDYVFGRPVGNLAQEIGGVGVTLLALAQAAGVDADSEEHREVMRVLSMPFDHFKKRNAAKNAAGFNVMEDKP